MHTAPFNPDATAHTLLSAWHTGALLACLPPALRPHDLAQGYAAQAALFQQAGGERAGWKLGVGSPAAMRSAQLARPLVGQLARSRLHESGVQLHMPGAGAVTVECEVAFVLARDIAPQPGQRFDAQDIRATCVTVELVRSRFVDRKAVGWPSFVADNVGFEALVVGATACPGLDLAVLRALPEQTVVYLDGQPKAEGLFGDTATDPLNSLQALFDHAAEQGLTLRAGDIVSTGAMCAPFDVEGAGHAIRVTYLGQELNLSL